MTATAQSSPDVAAGRRLGLFREEALEHHARGGKPGEPLRSGDRLTTCTTPIVLVTLLVTTLATLTLPAIQTATGTVTSLARPGIVTLHLPMTARADLRAGLAVEGLGGPSGLIDVKPGAGDVTATAPCTAGCAPGQRVTVLLGRGPVAAALVPSLRPLFEGER